MHCIMKLFIFSLGDFNAVSARAKVDVKDGEIQDARDACSKLKEGMKY